MYGLARTVNYHDAAMGHANIGTKAQQAHRDFNELDENGQQKPIQFIYCAKRGAEPQPTVFVTADEVIDQMAAARNSANQKHARVEIIRQLSDLTIRAKSGANRPFLIKNEHYRPRSGAPEHFIFSNGRFLSDDFLSDNEARIVAGDAEVGREFMHAANQCVFNFAETSEATTRDNTLVMWNDALVLHARGPVKTKNPQSGRAIEIVMTETPTAPGGDHFAA